MPEKEGDMWIFPRKNLIIILSDFMISYSSQGVFMKNRASVTEVSRNFADFVNRVAYRGEEFVLVRGKKPVAELRPVPQGRKLGDLHDLLKSLPGLGAEEAEGFARDIAASREEMDAHEELRDPWAF
jgi:antitoxin (DNA-binding transcriptional repressor) of toxin-antitoxin stability system